MKLDYSKIKNYDELIEIAKSLETDEQKVFLLCNYFIQNVSYNYAYLETIRIDKEDTGIEKMIKDIDSKYDSYNAEDRKKAKKELEDKMREDMKSRYKDERILEQELDRLLSAIDNYYGTIIPAKPERKVVIFGKECGKINATPERAIELVESIRTIKNENSELLNKTCTENGLLKQGVCAEFALFVKKYFDDLGMSCQIVHGQGTVNHVWNLVNVSGKARHLDLTNAIFVRDGYGENPTKAIPENWYMAETKEIFRMQPCRKIEKIGENAPKENITENNFTQYEQFIAESITTKKQNYDR